MAESCWISLGETGGRSFQEGKGTVLLPALALPLLLYDRLVGQDEAVTKQGDVLFVW